MDARYFKHVLGLAESDASTSCGSLLTYYHRGLGSESAHLPLVLIHGYPQSSFMWRHVIPLLPKDVPLFVPDIPGYGRSTPSQRGDDKRTIGNAILEVLSKHIHGESNRPHGKTKIVIAGHDRGARICHRLAVDGSSEFDIVGTVLLDIVPTLTQWQSFADSKTSTGSFHWPFLANVEFASSMIAAQGGGIFCQDLIERWSGKDEACSRKLRSDDSMQVYGDYFAQHSVIRATCEDYRAGAEEDVKQQKIDQESSKHIGCKTLVIFSADYLGGRFDLMEVWSKWMHDPTNLRVEGINGSGHFVAEEASEETSALIKSFLDDIEKD